MLLTPHHFQQAENFLEEYINIRLASVMAYEWGILDLAINQEALTNGNFELIRCTAITPDGFIVQIPQTDPPPAVRPVQDHFPSTAESVAVFLALPAKRTGGINYQLNGNSSNQLVRFVPIPAVIADETTGQNEQLLDFARGNLRVLFTDEITEGYTAIKLAVLERTATGQLTLAETYIPPVLKVNASPWLVNALRQLVEILITKCTTLSEQRRQRGLLLADFTSSEIATMWLLNTVNESLASLMHLMRTRVVHPERLYSELIRLAGRLMTLALNRHPKDIVSYTHLDLFRTFHQLFGEIRELLEIVIPTRCVPIPLEKIRKTLYLGRIQDDRLFQGAEFVLAVRASLPENRIIELTPLVFKIAAQEVIDTVVGAAMPGVAMRYVSPPPSEIPTRVGFHYFRLDTIGPFWDAIRGSKVLAIYVPDEFVNPTLELFAIKPL